MQDEDGYITLNTKKNQKSAPVPDYSASSPSLWRVITLFLLFVCMGMVFGLIALGIMTVTQKNYLQTDNENLSRTLYQLARKVCQESISRLDPNGIASHKCSPCEKNWRYYGESCYGFFKHNLTWQESKQYCAGLDATLPKIASQDVLQYFKVRTSYIRWVGLSRRSSHDFWTWEDGSAVSQILFELSGNAKENMNCGYFYNGKIHPAFCINKQYFICEKKAGPPKVIANLFCSLNLKVIDFSSSTNLFPTIKGAISISLLCGKSLTYPNISDMQEEEAYTSLQWDNPSPNHYEKYLPSNKHSGTNYLVIVTLCIICVSSLTTSIFFGIKWFQVSTMAMQQQGKLIQPDKANFTQWMSHDLQMKYCQTLMQNLSCSAQNHIPCPENWIHNGESCYYVFKNFTQWNASEKMCSKEDAKLLQIESKEEMIFITGNLKKIKTSFNFWVGLHQDGFRYPWLWRDGSSLPPDRLSQQRSQSTNSVCEYFDGKFLSSTKCDSWKYVICEKNISKSCI